MKQKPHWLKQIVSLEERFVEEARRLREQAELIPHGPLRDAALRKARQAEIASRMSQWVTSSGLQPPK